MQPLHGGSGRNPFLRHLGWLRPERLVQGGNDRVQAELTYEDTGLDRMGLGSITSDRAAVTGGSFRPTSAHTETMMVQGRGPQPVEIEMTGDFAGQAAFGGTDANGVAGYMDGDISFSYLGTSNELGPFRSVFYGTKEDN